MVVVVVVEEEVCLKTNDFERSSVRDRPFWLGGWTKYLLYIQDVCLGQGGSQQYRAKQHAAHSYRIGQTRQRKYIPRNSPPLGGRPKQIMAQSKQLELQGKEGSLSSWCLLDQRVMSDTIAQESIGQRLRV